MAFLSLLFLAFLVFSAAEDDRLLVMDAEELLGLFEVMGALLDDPAWPETHPLPCTDTPWPGVECELLEETLVFHVTKIHVGEDVVVPPCRDSAHLSFSLLKLPYLRTLSLINCFAKSPVSLSRSLFKSLSSLEHLTLVSNPSLLGQIPSTISNLSALKILSLSQNNLSGEIPKEIGGLIDLQQLDLGHNNLSGPIPREIGNLANLSILDLSYNSLQETLPDSISKLESLEKIDLSSNKIEGKLPQEFDKLGELVLLDLSWNSLTGPIPENLSGLQRLQYLTMEGNPVNSTLPSSLGSLTNLRVVTFSGCGLTGPIPTTLSNLTNLTALSLDNNRLEGTVPPELATLPELDALNLSGNHLTGELFFDQDFVERLGQRLDIRGNHGLCTNPELQTGNLDSRFSQNPSCPSAVFTGSGNETASEPDPGAGRELDPTMYGGDLSSGSGSIDLVGKNVVFPGLVLLLLLFGEFLVS